MKKLKRLFAGILVALTLMPIYAVMAGAACKIRVESLAMPRFSIIDNYNSKADKEGNTLKINAELSAYKTVDLSINVKVKKDGKFDDSFSSSKRGKRISLSETSDYEPGHTYTVEFEFNAGGEIHTTTKTVN